MSAELHELYRGAILDHCRRPRNVGSLEGAPKREGYNRLCGDRVTVYARVRDDVITEAAFQATGCAILTASASMMTETVKGKTTADVRALFDELERMLLSPSGGAIDHLGPLTAFAGVRQFPIRVRCVTLAWQTLAHLLASR